MEIAELYNPDLEPLERLLAGVQRAGDFFVRGTVEVPMPRVEVEGVGVLSFPLPGAQVKQIIAGAQRAPYGRGGETILDASVRKVWQVAPEKVRIAGKSWEHSFQQILATVTKGLGCSGIKVSAKLYKVLVYDEGGFFKAHRDTEKADGMFGTLVIVLPSLHSGGELIVRHAGREVVLGLSGGDVSELTFAAFYTDCEHEVRPITAGNRVCLVCNLIQKPTRRKRGVSLTAPLYDSEIEEATSVLERLFAETVGPTKLVWLLQHQYSPAGLSFAALKGEDAARVQVLQHAAEQAACAVHLGIVHIEETGAAEPNYDPYDYHGSGWARYGHEVEDVDSSDYDVIEVFDSREHHNACVDLLSQLVIKYGREAAPNWQSGLRDVAAAIVEALPSLLPASAAEPYFRRMDPVNSPDRAMVAELLDSLTALDAMSLCEAASAAIVASPTVFDPRTVLVPALESLRRREGDRIQNPDLIRLWQHAADFLLARSEFPPEPPDDWWQEVTISCSCGDCRELQAFARAPEEQVHRFRVRKDRRQHLHRTIDGHRLDMTHVTERKGSPQTLVCTKTLRTFDKKCEQHRADLAALDRLSELVEVEAAGSWEFADYLERIAAAKVRAPRPFVAP